MLFVDVVDVVADDDNTVVVNDDDDVVVVNIIFVVAIDANDVFLDSLCVGMRPPKGCVNPKVFERPSFIKKWNRIVGGRKSTSH